MGTLRGALQHAHLDAVFAERLDAGDDMLNPAALGEIGRGAGLG